VAALNSPFLPLLALLAGVLSFTSPCALPLVPGYLGYMSGVNATRGRTAGAAMLFVLGFSVVFTGLGAAASSLSLVLLAHRDLFQKLAGAAIIVLGLIVMGLIRPAWMWREGRPLLTHTRPGPGGALALGMAFALGWTPCIGPVLGAILVLASTRETVSAGATLLFVYGLGLGIPFLVAALLLERIRPLSSWLLRHNALLSAGGGLLLISMGVLVLLDRLNPLLAPALALYASVRWPPY
jgi:cytochrome c-type biogenesis protein